MRSAEGPLFAFCFFLSPKLLLPVCFFYSRTIGAISVASSAAAASCSTTRGPLEAKERHRILFRIVTAAGPSSGSSSPAPSIAFSPSATSTCRVVPASAPSATAAGGCADPQRRRRRLAADEDVGAVQPRVPQRAAVDGESAEAEGRRGWEVLFAAECAAPSQRC